MSNELRIDLEGGKYTVVMPDNGSLHAAKPDMEKAKRNAEMAEMCEAALKGEK